MLSSVSVWSSSHPHEGRVSFPEVVQWACTRAYDTDSNGQCVSVPAVVAAAVAAVAAVLAAAVAAVVGGF
jgi:hypothetical protein